LEIQSKRLEAVNENMERLKLEGERRDREMAELQKKLNRKNKLKRK